MYARTAFEKFQLSGSAKELKNEYVRDAYIGVPDDIRGEIPKAFVSLKDESQPQDNIKEDIQQHVKDILAKHEYPREIEFTEHFPRTTTGKIKRNELREVEKK